MMAFKTMRFGRRVMAMGSAAAVAGAAMLITVGSTASEATAQQEEAAANVFAVDSVHSSVFFAIEHMGVAKCYGMFFSPEGTYYLDADNLADSFVDMSIPMDSLDTGSENRDKHLKSPDFFSAKQFPKVSFKANTFKPTGKNTMRASGELTMLGVSKPVSVDISILGEGKTMQGYKSGFEASFTIKRSEFGMTKYIDNGGLGDEVELRVTVEGKKG